MSPSKSLVALTAALGMLGFAGTAFAQTSSTCTADTDCQHGYTCQVTAIVNGTTPACPPDSPCITTGTTGTAGAGGSVGGAAPHDAKDGGTSAPASTVITSTISTCVPGPCTIDSDCAAGMICHGETVTTCSGSGATPPCEAGTKCDTSGVVTQSQCTNQIVSTCTFKWALPCNVDADCGDGFACQPSIGGVCSGGSGVGGETGGGTSSSGTAGISGGIELLADTCMTTMTYPGSCHSLVEACQADTDCPSTWVCQDNTVPGAGTGGTAGAGGATIVPVPTDGGPPPRSGGAVSTSGGGADVAPPLNSKMCVAPYSAPIGVKDGGAGGRTGSEPASGPIGTGGSTAGGVPMGTSNEGSGSASGNGGAQPPKSTAGGTGGSSGTVAVSDTKVSGDSEGGCSVIPASGTSGPVLLAFTGLALLVARRRRS